jgi:hypothetical protein
MAESKSPKVYKFEAGEVAVWYDCIKAVSPAGDPVELRDEEAVALAEVLLRLANEKSMTLPSPAL